MLCTACFADTPLLHICSFTLFWILERLRYGVSINHQIFYSVHDWIERHHKFHVVIRQRRPQLAIGLGSPDNEQAQPTSEAEIPTLPSVSLPELRFSSFLPIGGSSSVMAFLYFFCNSDVCFFYSSSNCNHHFIASFFALLKMVHYILFAASLIGFNHLSIWLKQWNKITCFAVQPLLCKI